VGLPAPWVKHLPQATTDAIKKFEEGIRNSSFALGRLQDILKEELEQIDRSESTDSQFDTPNWDYLQAYRNGDRSRIRKLLYLLSFMDQ
jgi:hypothetical protein